VIKTPDLITSLAANVAPVKRLRPPVTRAACWLLLVALILALVSVSQGIRPDLIECLHDPAFAVSVAASLLTGVLAATAAFIVSLPDRSRFWLLLPVPAFVTWLMNIGYQCLTRWVTIDSGGISFGETAHCFATLVLTSLPLSLAMLVMLRYAAPLRPTAVTLMGSLAVAAITATALSLFHTIDATVMILIWNVGTAVLIVGLGGVLGRRMFQFVAPRTLPHAD